MLNIARSIIDGICVAMHIPFIDIIDVEKIEIEKWLINGEIFLSYNGTQYEITIDNMKFNERMIPL